MRAGSLMLAVLLLAGCAGALDPTPRPAGTPSATSPASATSAPTDSWRELAAGLSLDQEPFAVAAATDPEEMAELWQRLGQTPPPPDIDFERELVLFLGISGSSTCPERLERLFVDRAAATVHGEWAVQDGGQPCTDDLHAQGVLLAVARSSLPATPFMLSLRDAPICPECPDRPDQVVVDEPS